MIYIIATTLWTNIKISRYTYPSDKTFQNSLFTYHIALVIRTRMWSIALVIRTRMRYIIKTYPTRICLSCNNPNKNFNHIEKWKIAIIKSGLMFKFYKYNESPKMKSKRMAAIIVRDVLQMYEDLWVFIFLIQQFCVVVEFFFCMYVNILLVCLYIWF